MLSDWLFVADHPGRLPRGIVLSAIFGFFAVVIAAGWAWRAPNLAPLPSVDVTSSTPTVNSDPPEVPPDARCFQVELWRSFPKQDTAENQAANDPLGAQRGRVVPLQVELVGITQDPVCLYAAVYDREHDRLFMVKEGDQLKRHTVSSVRLDGIDVQSGNHLQSFKLTREER